MDPSGGSAIRFLLFLFEVIYDLARLPHNLDPYENWSKLLRKDDERKPPTGNAAPVKGNGPHADILDQPD